MGTTAGGLPYPEPTDPFGAGSQNIKALAEAIEKDTPAAIASGAVTWPSQAANGSGGVGVTFPVGRFTLPPAVTVAPVIAVPKNWSAGVGTPSAASVTLYGSNNTGAALGVPGRWIAVQDRTTAAVQLEPREGDTFGAFECDTDGCENAGIPIGVQTGYTDPDDGTARTIDAYQCGVCGAALHPAGVT
jgi:hypothetical protein